MTHIVTNPRTALRLALAKVPSPPAWVKRLLGDGPTRPIATSEDGITLSVAEHGGWALLCARVAGAAEMDGPTLQRQTTRAYLCLAGQLPRLSARHPVRMWNFIPDIRRNGAGDGGIDRYMIFNAGRFAAFTDWYGPPERFDGALPTATAVGHDGRELLIWALCAQTPGTAAANPRQTQPHRYSPRFGPLPPCFARATVVDSPAGRLVLVGGTASVRGEESTHIDNIDGQINETLENLASLIAAASGDGRDRGQCLRHFRSLRVYHPRIEHAALLRRRIAEEFGAVQDVELVRAELCRSELLVEIEGLATGDGTPPPGRDEIMDSNVYDACVIGGGPAGSTAAMILARKGLKAVVLEKTTFPRFHIGESLLPRNFTLIQELGLEPRVRKLPHLPKFGAEFIMGHGRSARRFTFDTGLMGGTGETFNIERAIFDEMLLGAAKDAGAEIRQGVGVKSILQMQDGDVRVASDDGEVRARWLIDASGQGTVVGRHLGLRKPVADRNLHKVAYFQHFDGVKQLAGGATGDPSIVMSREAWFWVIPLNATRTSVGMVTSAEFTRTVGLPAERMLRWGIAHCPLLRDDRMKDATGPDTNRVAADFSYTCKPYAGPGYFMVGDAAAFLDPIFSTGVCLSMMGGMRAAEHVADLIRNGADAEALRRQHIRFLEGAAGMFWQLIRGFYQHSFRELFLNGTGPLEIHRAVIAILGGYVFPQPAWSLRWRMKLFQLCMLMQKKLPLVPRQEDFSLLEEARSVAAATAGGTAARPAPVAAGAP